MKLYPERHQGLIARYAVYGASSVRQKALNL